MFFPVASFDALNEEQLALGLTPPQMVESILERFGALRRQAVGV